MNNVKVLTLVTVLSNMAAMDNTFTLPVRGYGDVPGAVALLSPKDGLYFSEWEWRLTDRGYAVRSIMADDGTYAMKPVSIFLHRAVMQAPPGDVVVDHINGNRLDNRRENLRLVTKQVNNTNRKSRSGRGFIGITFDKARESKPWVAQIRTKGASRTIGRYDTPEDAAWAYDTVARIVHGICHLNYPDRDPMPGVKTPDFTMTKCRKYVDYPGVTFDKRPGRKKPWMAFYYDKMKRRTKHLGMFATPESAAAVARSYRENQ
jgi:hypothetical protein